MLKDLKTTSKHTAIYAFGNIASKVIGLILIPLYTDAKYLSSSDYGVLTVLEATVALLIGLLTMAMFSSLTRWYWDEKHLDEQKSIFFTTWSFLAFTVIPVLFVLLYFSDQLSLAILHDVKFSFLFKLTIITAGVQVLNNQILCLAKLQTKSALYSGIQVFKFALVLCLILYGILVKGEGLRAVWMANVVGEVVVLLLLVPYAYKNSEFKFQSAVLKEMLIFGFPLMLASVSGVLLSVTDKYMLASMSSLENTGFYGLGMRIANTLKLTITTSLFMALSPLMMKKMHEPGNQRFYAKIMTYSAFLFVMAMLAMSLFSLEILKVFTRSTEYWGVNGLVPFLCFALMFGLLKDHASIGLTIMKKTKVIGGLIFLTSILNIGLNIVLIPWLDTYGAALSTLIAQFFFFIVMFVSAQKAYPIPYEIKKLCTLALLAGIFMWVGVLISDWNVYLRIGLKATLFMSFPFLLRWFNFYEKIELETIQNIFKQWRSPQNMKENISRFFG